MKKLLINNFDILRLLLAILVYFYHWNILTQQNISNSLFHLGGYAVDMFFIVSGFLIFWSYDNDQKKKHFYIKRFFRIFPLYALLIMIQTVFFIIVSDESFIEYIKYFISNILFLNFLSHSVGNTLNDLYVNAINGSLWTLKNEVIFYFLVPFIFAIYKKWGLYFLLILYGFSVVYMFLVDYIGIAKLLVQFPAQLRLFLVGVLLYILFENIKSKIMLVLVPLSIILMALFIDNIYFKFSIYPILLGVMVVFLVYFTKSIKINFDFSYSFYVLHFPIIQLALYFGMNPSNPTVSFVGLFMLILILSYLSEKYIEKRFVKVGRTIISKDKNKLEGLDK